MFSPPLALLLDAVAAARRRRHVDAAAIRRYA